MILDGMGIPYTPIDITISGNEEKKDFMRENAINKRCNDAIPLPPQFFHKEEYLGVKKFLKKI